MKTAYIVLGAQRSGTSATSHVLSEFGIQFGEPDRFIQFDHNPLFFELKWINDYNNKIINALGHQYTDFFLPIESDFEFAHTAELETEIQSLIGEEWTAETIGIKDPRISLTFPVWERILSDLNYDIKIVLAFRRPANFLRSNQRLFHNWEGWTPERHLKFWLQLNLAAVYFCRNYPIYFLNYDQLIVVPVATTAELADYFGLDAAKVPQAASVIKSEQTHHHTQHDTGVEFVDRTYQLLCQRSLSSAEYLQFRSLTDDAVAPLL